MDQFERRGVPFCCDLSKESWVNIPRILSTELGVVLSNVCTQSLLLDLSGYTSPRLILLWLKGECPGSNTQNS